MSQRNATKTSQHPQSRHPIQRKLTQKEEPQINHHSPACHPLLQIPLTTRSLLSQHSPKLSINLATIVPKSCGEGDVVSGGVRAFCEARMARAKSLRVAFLHGCKNVGVPRETTSPSPATPATIPKLNVNLTYRPKRSCANPTSCR